jgi:hypothetical protein
MSVQPKTEQFDPDYPHGSRSAGELINKSIYWMRNTRQADARRIAEGKPMVGPVWSYDPAGLPYYIHKDLVEYLRTKFTRAIPRVGMEVVAENPDSTGDSAPTAA